jgi:DNA (cytosine-5)-methyltransferase 1
MKVRTITTGSDFSGVGAFKYAMNRVVSKMENTELKQVFACDMDKYARKAYIANHGQPEYYPENVYDREIPQEPLDVYMTSPPCQGFSLAGNRKGSILFFNSLEFIQKNKPRYFIFENVKGLLSHEKENKEAEYGRTFNEWINLLGGKSVNGLPVLFPYEDSVPYHIYWTVLNAKDYGVPQNRERVFIIGIRDDQDNFFQWPKPMHLGKRLKDVLETEVDPKYFLSEKAIRQLIENNVETDHLIPGDVSNTIRVGGSGSLSAKHKFDMIKIVGNTNPSGNGMNGNVFNSDGISPTLSTNKGEGIKVTQLNPSKESGGKQPYKQNRVFDANGVSPVLDTECGRPSYCIPVLTPNRPNKRQNGRRFKEDGDPMFTITTQDRHGIFDGYDIRRLTPLECFRLMSFPDEHVQRSVDAGISDSQLYKQAGNSIVVDVLELIIEKLNL